jgi:predicted dithiol-disulfide oxidoreductase (DUF899 family)
MPRHFEFEKTKPAEWLAPSFAVSRAPYSKIAAYSTRMGWTFEWFSSGETDFNRDFGVSFTPEEIAEKKPVYNYGSRNPDATEGPGMSVFIKDADGKIFHTYSAYGRGLDMVNVAYHYLDLVPKGRDEGNRRLYWHTGTTSTQTESGGVFADRKRSPSRPIVTSREGVLRC